MADPRNIPVNQLDTMRAEVARENGIVLYRQYAEKQAAEFLKLDVSTVKRNRRAGRVPYVQYGNGGVRFMGIMLCDYILFGERSVLLWGAASTTTENIASATGTSPHGATAPRSIGHGPTPKPDAPSVLRLAQQAGRKPKSG